MRTAIHRLLLAVAGAGLFSTAGGADGRELHEEVRTRVLGSIGQATACSAGAVRDALDADPAFDRLLTAHRQRALAGVRHHPLGEDAVQETLLKVWKGRPAVLLESHDDVARYLSTATKRNLATRIEQATGRGRYVSQGGGELPEQVAEGASPVESAAFEDLRDTLAGRLDRSDIEILGAYLAGESSQREIARSLGLSRYAVRQATERIGAELDALVADCA